MTNEQAKSMIDRLYGILSEEYKIALDTALEQESRLVPPEEYTKYDMWIGEEPTEELDFVQPHKKIPITLDIKSCDKCAMNGSGSKYCENCQKSGKMLICPSCGLDVHSDFKHCPRCGARMTESEDKE